MLLLLFTRPPARQRRFGWGFNNSAGARLPGLPRVRPSLTDSRPSPAATLASRCSVTATPADPRQTRRKVPAAEEWPAINCTAAGAVGCVHQRHALARSSGQPTSGRHERLVTSCGRESCPSLTSAVTFQLPSAPPMCTCRRQWRWQAGPDPQTQVLLRITGRPTSHRCGGASMLLWGHRIRGHRPGFWHIYLTLPNAVAQFTFDAAGAVGRG